MANEITTTKTDCDARANEIQKNCGMQYWVQPLSMELIGTTVGLVIAFFIGRHFGKKSKGRK